MIFKKFAKKGLGIYKNLKKINVSSLKQISDENPVKLVGFVKCFNEGKTGNLERCLKHLSKFCDDIVFCDDSSTDNSLVIAKKYTKNIIVLPDEFKKELDHKQKLLELALSLNPDWIIFLDPDEVFDKEGENGGIRKLCHYGDKHKIDSFSFLYYNLWKGTDHYRVDELWNKNWQRKLWKNTGNLKFNVRDGLHLSQFPLGLKNERRTDIKLIHYGFASEDKINNKFLTYQALGQSGWALQRIKDENSLKLKKFEKEWFPLSSLEVNNPKLNKIMKVNVVTVNSGWILQKIAERIVSSAPDNTEFLLSHLPRDDVDVNFYVDIQNCYRGKSKVKDVGFFTHLDHDSIDHLIKNKHWLTCDYIIHMNKKYFDKFTEYYPKEKMSVLKSIEIFPEFTLKKLKLGIVQRGGFEGKGHDFMLRMANYDYMKNFEFLFCGNGWDEIISLYSSKGIKCHLIEENYKNYPQVYDSIDYLLIPSLWEGGPMSVPEALAKGVPIISSDVGWVSEFNVEYLFQPNDEKGLLDILQKIREPLVQRRKKIEN
ncbi:MAG: glycosyltransferase, partial [Nitrosarchaeum sp.]|nr:glycosyltransferase [Nitrosarchaeum sp.]